MTAHERTPVCSPKNHKASLTIFVLPIDRRSFIVRVLNELLVDPAAPIVATPDFSRRPIRSAAKRSDALKHPQHRQDNRAPDPDQVRMPLVPTIGEE
jgi:hypothetical protein